MNQQGDGVGGMSGQGGPHHPPPSPVPFTFYTANVKMTDTTDGSTRDITEIQIGLPTGVITLYCMPEDAKRFAAQLRQTANGASSIVTPGALDLGAMTEQIRRARNGER